MTDEHEVVGDRPRNRLLAYAALLPLAVAACSTAGTAEPEVVVETVTEVVTEEVTETVTKTERVTARPTPPRTPSGPATVPTRTTTSDVSVPSQQCIAAFQAVAEVDIDDSNGYDRAYLATTELCESYEDWITTLHEHPETVGYRPDATPEELENEIYLVCIPVTDTPVCRDAERLGLLG